MGATCICTPLVADLFCSIMREFVPSLSDDYQSEVIKTFNSTSLYLDDLVYVDNNFFDSMVNHINPSEIQLNKANVSDTKQIVLLKLNL